MTKETGIRGCILIVLALFSGQNFAAGIDGCDLVGKDLLGMPAKSAEICSSQCQAKTGCRGWVFVSGWNHCSLKSEVRRQAELHVYAGQVSRDPSGARFIAGIQAESDHRGKDLRRVTHIKDPEECGKECLKESTCQGFAYFKGYGDCWLKKTEGKLYEKKFICGKM